MMISWLARCGFFLDSRYTDEGTEAVSTDLQVAAGDKHIRLPPPPAKDRSLLRQSRSNTRIQYDAKVDDVRKIERYY